jgi:hypothetical protein
MLDSDLAELYGVSSKRLNEQVKRNQDRFPADFMFRLTAKEKAEVVANCDHLQALKFSSGLPNAFIEHGAVDMPVRCRGMNLGSDPSSVTVHFSCSWYGILLMQDSIV